MKLNRPKLLLNSVKYYFISGVVEGVLALTILMLLPPDPKNAWLLGYSKIRLATASGMLVVLGVFVGLSLKTWRNKPWLRKMTTSIKGWVDELGWFFPVIWGIFIFVFFAPYVYLVTQPVIHPTIGRLIPVIVWGFMRCIQTLLVYLVFKLVIPSIKSESAQGEFVLKIKPLKVAVIFALISALLVIINISVNLVDDLVRDENLFHYTRKLYVDFERNIPTYYSSIMLWFAGVFFGIIAVLRKREQAPYVFHWFFMAALFLFFSMDEVAGVHEMMNRPMRRWLHPQGVFSFQWVTLGIPLLIIFVVSYIRFFLHLPSKHKWLFALSAALYVGGALGFEMIGAGYSDVHGKENLIYAAIATTEEMLELAGITLLIYTLLEYIADSYHQTKFILWRANTAAVYLDDSEASTPYPNLED